MTGKSGTTAGKEKRAALARLWGLIMRMLQSAVDRGIVCAFTQQLKSLIVKAAVVLLVFQGVRSMAQAGVSPASLNWVSVSVGSKGAQKVVTLTNSSTTALTISSITLAGTNPGDFEIFSKTCGTSLAASASCTANILFAPTTTGDRSATLDFKDTASNSPQTMALTGDGVNPAGGVTATPSGLTFASTIVGSSSASQTATLSNGGTAAIAISSVAITGADAGDFSITSKTCGASLAASASCAAMVAFKPTATGARSATLSFTDAASNSPQTVALSGTGATSTTGGSASVSPTTLNWVSVDVGAGGAPKPVTLTNGGTAAITISSIATSGADPGDFRITSKTCGTSLAASASCTATIEFYPTAGGARSATLTFTDSASNSPQTMTLTGDGVGASSGVSVNPSSLSFASTVVGSSSASQPASLINGGTASIAVSSVAITGTNAGDFSIASNTCGASLAASASCVATVGFKPTATGTRTAALTFTDAASNSPQTVALSGTGAATFSISPLNPTVVVNGTLQFSANESATWTATCGTIGSGTGAYIAPATAESCTVTATASGSGVKASTTVTVSSSGQVVITPATAALHAIGTTQFSANQSVTWSTSCGTISSSGLFTAPTTANTCTVTATAVENTANKGTATAAVTVVNYTMRKNGVSGNGVQTDELVLTPANVSLAGNFKQKWSASVDASIWTQPLYLNAVTIGGKTRNALYVATSNDSVYAFDADTGAQLWKTSFLSTGVTAVAGTSLKISNQTGILGTPVIDPVKGVLYVVAETSEDNATTFPHRLHALNVLTGAEILGGGVLISNPDLAPLYKFQRPGLLLADGNIYVGFGSIEDRAPYHGMLFAFDENTLEQVGVFVVAPTGSEAGIWMSGSTPVADSSGNIYVSTGNGSADGIHNFGESIVRLSPTLEELDYFTVYNYAAYDDADLDLGSGTVIVVPDQTGPYPHELIACGKPTPIYVLNRDSLGGLGTTSDNIVQRLDGQLGQTGDFRDSGEPCYNSPGMWQQNVYFAANHDVLKMFTLDASTGMLSTKPVSEGTFIYQWPGADPVISSNGTTNGIVWTMDSATSTLRAVDATNVSNEFYTSASLGSVVRWVPPTVVNGHVYVALSGKIACFGVSTP